MKQSTLDRVKIFHETYGLQTLEAPDISNESVNQLRVSLLEEEVTELKEALQNNDMTEVLDALTDIQYVLDGAYLSFGLAHLKETAFAEVHRSNMSKLDSNGKPIYREDGKIMKGPNYSHPDIAQFLDDKEEAA